MLLWAHEIIGGELPSYETGPTPHPLVVGVASPLTVFGRDVASQGTLLLGAVAFATLVVATYVSGKRAFSVPAGLVAALAVLVSPKFIYFGASAYQGLMFLALVACALVLELREARRGRSVLALSIAGLIRPEAWLLSRLYWAYLYPTRSTKRRVLDAFFVVVPPLLWAASDMLVTGQPLWSLTSTQAGSEALGRPTGVGVLPSRTAKGLLELLTSPAVAAALVGIVLTAVAARRRSTALVGLLGLAGGVGVVGLAVVGLPVVGKYFLVPSLAVAVFFGATVGGWTRLPRRSEAASTRHGDSGPRRSAGRKALNLQGPGSPGEHLVL